jgi:transposase-like protein
MDRNWLAHELERGRSIADIAREVDRHPATVSYWVGKYGLASQYVRVYAPRGGVEEAHLQALVERGLSIREIAAELELSAGTVRHWLRRFGLRTERARRVIPGEPLRECRVHGLTTFRRFSGGLRCPRCVSEGVTRRRRRVKEILKAEAGGSCVLCGYDRYAGALQFHHLDPASKRFQIAGRGVTRSLAILREEVKNCVLLCANCHAEVEAGFSRLPISPA